MEYDAFSAGVEIGGLRSRDEIKILICYIVKGLDKPITREHLTEILQDKGIANYFDVSQSLSELVQAGSVSIEFEDDDEYLYLSDEGRKAVDQLENDLPKTVREKAINAAVESVTRARRERETKIEIAPVGSGYNVTFTIFDKEEVLMRLTLYAADISQANLIKENFLRDPVSVYSGIIASLMV